MDREHKPRPAHGEHADTRSRDAEIREPWEPPAVVSEEVFETLALACGKLAGARCRRRGSLTS